MAFPDVAARRGDGVVVMMVLINAASGSTYI